MKIKFPKLGSLLSVDKEIPNDDYKKLIHIRSGYALVFQGDLFIAVDLREYIKRECQIEDSDELGNLSNLVNIMEGKSFTKAFWDELKTPQEVSFNPVSITISNGLFIKNLLFDNVISDISSKEKFAKKILNKKSVGAPKFSFHGDIIYPLLNVFKSELKNDSVLFSILEEGSVVKFSGRSKEYIFGFFSLDFDGAQEFTNFQNIELFLDKK